MISRSLAGPRASARARGGGVALMLVLFALIVGTILAMSFAAAQATSTGISQNLQRHARARAIAESGLAMALRKVRSEANWRTAYPNGAWITGHAWGGGAFTIQGEDGVYNAIGDTVVGDGSLSNNASDPAVLTSTGSFAGVTHTVRIALRGGGGGGTAAYGAMLSGSLELVNIARINSYDSSKGPYGGTNIGSSAAVATNATAAGSVRFDGHSMLRGSVWVGAGANPATVVSGGRAVSGGAKALPAPLAMPAVAPWPSGVGDNLGDRVYSSGVTTLTTSMHVDKLEIGNSATLLISGHVVIRVNQDFLVHNHAQLQVLANSSLKLYVGESIDISNNTLVNTLSGDPSRLTIYGQASDKLYSIGSHSQLCAVLDAPESSLKIHNNADFFGAFIGKSLQMSNSAGFHADVNPALRAAHDRLTASAGSVAPTSEWLELP